MKTRTLVIFVKEPVAGRVKTRLGGDIGLTNAAWWFRHQSQKLIRRLSKDQRWQVHLAVCPDRNGAKSRFWPRHLPKWKQGTGSLGDRMGRVMRLYPPGPVVIVGADIPGIMPHHIEKAFKALGAADAVLGPAPDGGYWLIGLARGRRAISGQFLQDIRWSHEETMNDTIKNIEQVLGPDARITFLDTLRDVDRATDL